jgi:hypothetical protein
MQNSQQAPTPLSSAPDETDTTISLFDVLDSIRRNWLIIVVLTGLSAALGAFYIKSHPPLARAVVVLNTGEYEIFSDESGAVPYPFLHHLDLGESKDFRRTMQDRLKAEGLEGEQATTDMGDVFELEEAHKREGPIEIICTMRTQAAAVRGLELWITEYRAILPAYRARQLLLEIDRRVEQHTPQRIEKEAVIAGLRGMLTAEGDAGADGRWRDAIQARILDLQVDILASDHAHGFSQKVAASLQKIVEGAPFVPLKSPVASSQDPKTCARLLLQDGWDRLFSRIQPLREPNVMPYRVVAICITAFIFFTTVVVFVDWLRTSSRTAKAT